MVSMFIMVVIVVMMILFQMDVEFHPFDGGLGCPASMDVVITELQFFQFFLELLQINPEVEHGADEHVATYSTEDIQIESLHLSSPAASALIWLAAKPAPKPLFMFTTVRPLLQLFNIASSAVNPPR